MSDNEKRPGQDPVLTVFLAVFILISFLASFMVVYQLAEVRLLKDEKGSLALEKSKLETKLKSSETLYAKSEEMASQVRALQGQLTIYRTRSWQMERLLDTRIYRDSLPCKVAYLTFDDGPTRNTGPILDILKEYNIQATFFVIGNNTELGKEMYRRIVDEGHTLANHTYSHNYGSMYKSTASFFADFFKLEDFLYENTGVRPTVMRFPGGSNNHVSRKYGGWDIMSRIADEMTRRGYLFVDWDVESGDSERRVKSATALVNQVMREVQFCNDPVILFHDTHRNLSTVEALPLVIERLEAEGYVFLPITERFKRTLPQFTEPTTVLKD